LYDAADHALAALDHDVDAAAITLCFELTALRVLGHLPALADCAACGGAVADGARVPFGMLAGGVLCADCRAGQRQVVSVSRAVLEALRGLAEDESPDWSTIQITRENRGEARGVMNQYLCTVLGKRPRMHAFLGGA
jgi:DNA repair protein RecO (recombination protein O)